MTFFRKKKPANVAQIGIDPHNLVNLLRQQDEKPIEQTVQERMGSPDSAKPQAD